MGKKSKRKKAPKPDLVQGVPADLAKLLSQGLSKEQMTDPELMGEISRAVMSEAAAGHGPVISFTDKSAPTAVPPSGLPELTPAEAQDAWQGTVLPLRPSQVIDLHTHLYDVMRQRNPFIKGYLDSFMRDALERRSGGDDQMAYEAWGVMFQPAMDADQYMGLLARQLATARTYQVTSRMTDIVDRIYEKTASETSTFRAEDVPWPSGFVFLDKPLSLRDRHGKVVKNRAISWNMEIGRFDPGPGDEPIDTGPRPCVRIVCWSWWADEDDYSDPEAAQHMLTMGGLALAHSVILPFNHPFRSLAERRAENVAPDDVSRWLHALWLVMESEIPAMRRAADIERHAARRAMKSLHHKDVTVVLLRRTASKDVDEESGHRLVDWTHRWVVQGFWRHFVKQDHHAVPDQSRNHCLVCGIRISWVRPHMRGPSDKPLQVKEQLYRLAR